MPGSRAAQCRTVSLPLLLLSLAAARVEAQRTRDVHLTVSALVLASAARVDHAEVSTLASRTTAPAEREVTALVTARSSGETVLWIMPRVDGVAAEVIGAGGRVTPLGAAGIPVARTSGDAEISVPVLLRLRSADPELLASAVRAPLRLRVDSSAR